MIACATFWRLRFFILSVHGKSTNRFVSLTPTSTMLNSYSKMRLKHILIESLYIRREYFNTRQNYIFKCSIFERILVPNIYFESGCTGVPYKVSCYLSVTQPDWGALQRNRTRSFLRLSLATNVLMHSSAKAVVPSFSTWKLPSLLSPLLVTIKSINGTPLSSVTRK